jgi:hypothetical protein
MENPRVTIRTTIAGHLVTDTQCFVCGSKPGWPCRQPGGAFTAPHQARLEGFGLRADTDSTEQGR